MISISFVRYDRAWKRWRIESLGRFGTRLLVALVFGSAGCGAPEPQTQSHTASPAAAELPKVATIKAARKPIVQKTEQPGRLEAFTTTPIYAKTSGYLDQLLVDIGDRVSGPKVDQHGKVIEQGQLLAQLSAPELDEELRQKSALISQAAAELEQARASVTVAQSLAASALAGVDECLAGQRRAEALYQGAKSESDRIERLVSSKTVTQKLADEVRQQLKASDAARDEASAKHRWSIAKHMEADVAIAKAKADARASEARLRVAEAEHERVKALCGYLQIRAPFSGVVTQRNVDTGSLIQAAKGPGDAPLFVLVKADVVRLQVDVPESDAGLVALGGPATIAIPALAPRTFQATISRTSWALQQGTRTLKCELDIPNQNGDLRPGMYAQVDLTLAQKSDALTLPRQAAVQQDGQTHCLVVGADGRLIRKPVRIGLRSALDVEIVSGLDGTEDVIAANVAAFKEGQAVEKIGK